MARHAQGDDSDALDDCNRAIKLDGKHAIAYMIRSVLRAKFGDQKGAIADRNRALKLDPQTESFSSIDTKTEAGESVSIKDGKSMNKCCDGSQTKDKDTEFDWGSVSEVGGHSLDKVLHANAHVVMFCYASWCGPCMDSRPVVCEAATQHDGKIKFVRLNTDRNKLISVKYQIRGIPMYIMFCHSKVIDTVVGNVSSAVMKEKIDKFLMDARQ